MPNKKSTEVDKKFVLAELDKIKQAIDALDKCSDKLYSTILFEEARKFVIGCETITAEEIQVKYKIGYGRASHLLSMLKDAGVITMGRKNSLIYKVNKE